MMLHPCFNVLESTVGPIILCSRGCAFRKTPPKPIFVLYGLPSWSLRVCHRPGRPSSAPPPPTRSWTRCQQPGGSPCAYTHKQDIYVSMGREIDMCKYTHVYVYIYTRIWFSNIGRIYGETYVCTYTHICIHVNMYMQLYVYMERINE